MSEFVTTVYKVKYSLERPNYESSVTDGDLVKCFCSKKPMTSSGFEPPTSQTWNERAAL